MKLSILTPFVPHRSDAIEPYARLVEHGSATRLWQGENILLDPFLSFTSALVGRRIPVGIAVSLLPLRHPVQAAIATRSLAAAVRSSTVVGFGPGAVEFQAGLEGRPYGSPLTACREYLTIVRQLLERGTASVSGTYFSCDLTIGRVPSPSIGLGLGVLRPGMARLAGEIADVAITWLAPACYIDQIVAPALRAGAESVGRHPPRLVAMVPVGLRRPGSDGGRLAAAGSSAHLQAGHYQDMLRRAGIPISGRLEADADALVEGGGYLYGSADEVAAQLGAYRDVGVDEVVLNLTGVHNLHGPDAALDDMRSLTGLDEPGEAC